jgi:excisionase family DNA binding protein
MEVRRQRRPELRWNVREWLTWKEDPMEAQSSKRWYAAAEVAEMLGFGLSKTKLLIAMREIRSVKVGAHRRILPEWVDEYIAHVTHVDSA